eukprot:COSAG04_NODE_9906_length_822_cov_0.680498_1_plen_136_part_10
MVRVWRAGALLKRWLNEFDNNLFSALTFSGGAGFRARILKDEPELSALLSSYSDEELFDTITNLGVSTRSLWQDLDLASPAAEILAVVMLALLSLGCALPKGGVDGVGAGCRVTAWRRCWRPSSTRTMTSARASSH